MTLSASLRAVCFVRVPFTRIRLGVRVACITVAATLGGLVTLGSRHGGVVELFAAGGWALLPAAGVGVTAVAGAVIHTVWITVWTLLYALVARAHRGWQAFAGAVATAVLAYAMAPLVGLGAVGPMSIVTTGERAMLHLVFAFALAAGMRLARTW